MAKRHTKPQTGTAKEWKIGTKVDIGTLRGLVVTSIRQEGNLQMFCLRHPKTQREYTFVPGGLRKTFDPPPPQVQEPAPTMVSPAVPTTRVDTVVREVHSLLATKLRRRGDGPLKAKLESLITILTNEPKDAPNNADPQSVESHQ